MENPKHTIRELYHVYWKNSITKETGERDDPLTLKDAVAWIELGEKLYPHVEHYLRPVADVGSDLQHSHQNPVLAG